MGFAWKKNFLQVPLSSNLMKHIQDVFLSLISYKSLNIWGDGADVKPWLKTERKKKINKYSKTEPNRLQ